MKHLANLLLNKYKLILFISLLVFGLSVILASKLNISSDMEELLPHDSQTLHSIREFEQYFDSQESGIVVVQGDTEMSKHFLAELEQQLLANEIDADLLYKVDLSSLKDFGLLYLDTSFFIDLETALNTEDIEEIDQLLTSLKDNQSFQSEKNTIQYITNDDENVFLLMIRFKLDKNVDFLESRELIYDQLRETIDYLLTKEEFLDLEAGLTGGAFIQDIEADRVALDGFLGTFFITILFIIFLIVLSFRRTLLLTSVIYPLILGALLTAAFAYLFYGSINVFSMSFALLLVGLGIDFSIHLIARYLEERENGEDVSYSVKNAIQGTGVSITIGAITTSVAFFTFVLAKFKAFEQMGIISGMGIILLCTTMIMIVPALMMIIDSKRPFAKKKKIKFTFLYSFGEIIEKKPSIFILSILVLLPLLFVNVKNTEVIGDLDKIYPDNIESKKWEAVVKEQFDYNPNTLTFMVENEEVLKDVVRKLEKRADVEKILSIYEYLPEQQEYKTEVINKLMTFLENVGYPQIGIFNINKMEINDLPANLIANFAGKEGRLLVEVIPAVNIYEEAYYNELKVAILNASGNTPVSMAAIMNEVIGLVKEDIIKISILCIVIVAIFLLVIFKSIKEMLICVTPVVLTLYVTIGVLPLLNLEINILSIAALPLLIGIGIDSSIHLLHRLKTQKERNIGYALMTTGKAIILSAMTTCIGFGSLIFINHPGMAMLGATVSLGLLICLIITLTVLPSLYRWLK
ncbi:efflux RND transporter permease subunit [Anaerobacillus alkalidiazotrophicus]|nr:MMPL family transporter [Anaerobacillus alkalidiazotrophicus]